MFPTLDPLSFWEVGTLTAPRRFPHSQKTELAAPLVSAAVKPQGTFLPTSPLQPPPHFTPDLLLKEGKEEEQPTGQIIPSPTRQATVLPPLHKRQGPKAIPQQTRRQPFQSNPGRESPQASSEGPRVPAPSWGGRGDGLRCQKHGQSPRVQAVPISSSGLRKTRQKL